MRLKYTFRAPMLVCALRLAAPALAQQATIPIRAVTAPSATSPLLGSPDEIREIAPDKLLVNDGTAQKLLLFGATLQNPTILSDTAGHGTPYPRFAKLIAYTGDSTLFADGNSRTFVLIDAQGKLGRTLAPPRVQDFNMIISTGFVGTDARGRLVYQGFGAMSFPKPACAVDDVVKPAQPVASTDSAPIIRADFDARRIDTIGRAKTNDFGKEFPAPTVDANCKVLSAHMFVNPSIPAMDSWTVTSRGAIAIVRSHDYHIDWIEADGTTRSTPKMAFDWRRLTDADKKSRVDSARKTIDSLTSVGGYRLQMCAGGRALNFTASPADPPQEINLGRGPAGAGGRGNECQTVTVTAQFAPLDSMADYIPPIREYSARADLDGNVWILPSTSASAKGGLLYDVVNTNGAIVERVQLPAGRSIAGFGRGGVLYLQHGDWKAGYVIEKVKVVR